MSKRVYQWVGALVWVGLVSGCAAEMRTPDGYFLDRQAVAEQGGVGNYVDRNQFVQVPEEGGASASNGIQSSSAELRSLVREPVLFNPGSDEISSEAQQTLARVGDYLAQNHDTRITVEGFCDNHGNLSENADLSERRAYQVALFLEAHGADKDQLRIVARGEADPLASNMSAAGRAMNRRVELHSSLSGAASSG